MFEIIGEKKWSRRKSVKKGQALDIEVAQAHQPLIHLAEYIHIGKSWWRAKIARKKPFQMLLCHLFIVGHKL
jgi:hypothetical protein